MTVIKGNQLVILCSVLLPLNVPFTKWSVQKPFIHSIFETFPMLCCLFNLTQINKKIKTVIPGNIVLSILINSNTYISHTDVPLMAYQTQPLAIYFFPLISLSIYLQAVLGVAQCNDTCMLYPIKHLLKPFSLFSTNAKSKLECIF